jgi:hypothetical protein
LDHAKSLRHFGCSSKSQSTLPQVSHYRQETSLVHSDELPVPPFRAS